MFVKGKKQENDIVFRRYNQEINNPRIVGADIVDACKRNRVLLAINRTYTKRIKRRSNCRSGILLLTSSVRGINHWLFSIGQSIPIIFFTRHDTNANALTFQFHFNSQPTQETRSLLINRRENRIISLG